MRYVSTTPCAISVPLVAYRTMRYISTALCAMSVPRHALSVPLHSLSQYRTQRIGGSLLLAPLSCAIPRLVPYPLGQYLALGTSTGHQYWTPYSKRVGTHAGSVPDYRVIQQLGTTTARVAHRKTALFLPDFGDGLQDAPPCALVKRCGSVGEQQILVVVGSVPGIA
eukprot:951406-Rhodomonas_salina.2